MRACYAVLAMPSADPYLKAWRSRALAAEVRAGAWRAERLAEAKVAARALVEQLRARRVLLFGSLARGSAGPDSDVDLWVEGLPEGAYLEAVNIVRQSIPATEVDLVVAEWSRASLRERALREGIVLHGG
jgi:predicted nucleotidyltransferase